MTVEDTFRLGRATEDSKRYMKTVLQGKLGELISIEAYQWVERVSDSECLLITEHTVSCAVPGMGGAVEKAIEGGLRDSFRLTSERM